MKRANCVSSFIPRVAGGPGRSYLLIMFTTSFTCRISVRVHCPVVPCFYELSGVVLSCFIFSRQTSWTEVFLIQPEDSLIPKVKATVYSRSWVRKLVETSGETLCLIIESSVAKLQAPSLIVTVPQAFGPTTITTVSTDGIYLDLSLIPRFRWM